MACERLTVAVCDSTIHKLSVHHNASSSITLHRGSKCTLLPRTSFDSFPHSMTGHTIFWIGTSAAAHFSLFVSFRRLVLVREVSSETRRKSSPPSATSFLQSSYKSQTKFNMGIKLLTLKEIGETTRNCLHVRI